MRVISRPTIPALILLLCLTALAQNPAPQGREVTSLYKANCAGCHGTDMSGGSGGSLLGPQWRYGGDDASVARSMRERHHGLALPPLDPPLNQAETRALIVYLREKQAAAQPKKAAPQPGAVIESEKASFRLEPVIETGLDEPWSLAFLPGGRLLVTERKGNLRIVDHGQVLPDPVRNTPAVFGGEGGLLDVVLDPDYAQNGWIYLSYGDKNAGLGMSAVIRGRLRDGAFVDTQQVFKADPACYRDGGMRFGSRLVFDGKGHLFFSEGDRAHPGDEQDLSRPNGKVHRVNTDGSVPKDNPFVGQPHTLPTIWTYGHRNPQGLAFDPVSGEIWESEHGPRGGDEINILHRGHNYGWPLITYGINYDGTPITDHLSQPGLDQPITYWVPSIAASPIAFYTGKQFPQWRNNLFVGALASQELRRLVVSKNSVVHQELLIKGIGRVRGVVNDPDGELYLVLNEPNRILRVTSTSIGSHQLGHAQ